jgi:hypothetical protein
MHYNLNVGLALSVSIDLWIIVIIFFPFLFSSTYFILIIMDITVDFSDSTDKHIKILDLGECLDEATLNLEDIC